ncbi:baeRF3 domain-containing protein [Streptomyces sp. 3N207]|uniref:baeRF3 domain-containing protein n=1 Tax=Streptomyces sp. 3N207 TaxID=3457417 RepID=UPI003FD4A8FE
MLEGAVVVPFRNEVRMRTNDLTNEVLANLRKPRPYPAVTLVLPTHRTKPDKLQDPVRLRNLIAETGRRLAEDPQVPAAVRADVIKQLEQAENELDLMYALDTLVVFAAQGEHQFWHLTRRADTERIVINDTFLTRNLVAARAQNRPYWVLTFDEEKARLWNGMGEQLTEEHRYGFPVEHEPNVSERERASRTGDFTTGYRDEAELQHLRDVDAGVAKVLETEPRPLLVAGLQHGLTALADVGAHASRNALATVPKGGLANARASVVYDAVAPARAELVQGRADEALRRLGDAIGRKEFAAGIDEVWRAAQEGRLALLAVEEPYRQKVRLTGGHLSPVADDAVSDESGEVRDDIVDETVESALSTEAEVVFVADGALAEHRRIAGVVRYTWAG